MGSSSYAPHPLSPLGRALPRASSWSESTSLALNSYLIQEEGGRMVSSVLQGQHPHFQLTQVRKRAQSQTQKGSAASVWGAGEMVEAAPPLLTQSPGQMSRNMSAWRFPGLQTPSSLGIGGKEQDPGPKESLNFLPGEVMSGKSKKSGSDFPKTVQPHPPSVSS